MNVSHIEAEIDTAVWTSLQDAFSKGTEIYWDALVGNAAPEQLNEIEMKVNCLLTDPSRKRRVEFKTLRLLNALPFAKNAMT